MYWCLIVSSCFTTAILTALASWAFQQLCITNKRLRIEVKLKIIAPIPHASIISGTGADICAAVVVARFNGRVVLVYLGSQCTKFHAAGWTCWFFYVFLFGAMYLAWCDFWHQQRVNVCEELRPIALSRIITGDESWIYCFDFETKQQSFQWKGPNSPRAQSRSCTSFSFT
jgi:hypothetical protein